jgi:hypothetical protein
LNVCDEKFRKSIGIRRARRFVGLHSHSQPLLLEATHARVASQHQVALIRNKQNGSSALLPAYFSMCSVIGTNPVQK